MEYLVINNLITINNINEDELHNKLNVGNNIKPLINSSINNLLINKIIVYKNNIYQINNDIF